MTKLATERGSMRVSMVAKCMVVVCMAAGALACSSADGVAGSAGGDAGDTVSSGDAGAADGAVSSGDASTDGAPTGDSAHVDGGAGSCAKYLGAAGTQSAWVHPDADGKLAYKTMPRGDRIMDFSFAGYMGGGVALPSVPTKVTLMPSGGDDTNAITAAIAQVSAMPLVGGVRGAVLLAPGTFNVSGSFEINASGVVLRGSGSGAGGTTVDVSGASRWVMRVRGGGAPVASGSSVAITDAYVPSGATSFTVSNASALHVGDPILVARPVTTAWVHFMGMDTLTRNGMPQTWLAPGTAHQWERTIASITGNTIAIDIPLSDSLDAQYVSPPGASIAKYTFAGRIAQVGVEHIHFTCPPRSATQELSLLRMDAAEDAWIDDVTVHNFTEGIWSGPEVRRLTIESAVMTHDPTTYVTSEAPFDFWLDSTETLIHKSSSTGGDKIWYLATQDNEGGPNVALDFTGAGIESHVTAHQRWATGLLIDNVHVTGGISLGDNGSLGSGEGWSMGWGVVWNSSDGVAVQAPPGAMNWSIGSIASPPTTNVGTYESNGANVAIGSLYVAQLCERKGPGAVAVLGY
jgi:hypothetical protein